MLPIEAKTHAAKSASGMFSFCHQERRYAVESSVSSCHPGNLAMQAAGRRQLQADMADEIRLQANASRLTPTPKFTHGFNDMIAWLNTQCY
jgi:hypothetical protein